MIDAETSLGWLFNNPDTGREYSKQHPLTSGECDDATHIIPATATNLLAELKLAWEIAEEERVSEARKGAKWIEAADTIEALRAENAKLDWQDMKTAPTDGTFIIAGLRVYSAKDKSFLRWDVYVVAKEDETGDAITMHGDDCGWWWEDFEVWKPLNLKAAAARAEMGDST